VKTPVTITRYIRYQVLLSSTFILVAFIGLFAFFDFLAAMDRLLRPGVKISAVVLSIALGLPARVYELAPLAALIGAVYTLAGLANTSQFTAMRSAGLGMRVALLMMLKIGLVIVLITVIVGEIVTPLAERLSVVLSETKLASVKRDGRLSSGQWLRDTVEDAEGTKRVRYVNFKAYAEEEGITDLTVYEFTVENRLLSFLHAKQAKYEADGRWLLLNVQHKTMVYSDNERALSLQEKTLAADMWHSSIDPDVLSGVYIDPEKMSALQLLRYARFLKENRQRTDKVDLALAKKVFYPLAIFVMMIIALPFAYLHTRNGGVSFKIFIGIMLGIAFYLLNNLFSHLTVVASMQPLLSASIPSAIALLLGLLGLWWVNRV
jgi:lipopolysaccharide export system permease protein